MLTSTSKCLSTIKRISQAGQLRRCIQGRPMEGGTAKMCTDAGQKATKGFKKSQKKNSSKMGQG